MSRQPKGQITISRPSRLSLCDSPGKYWVQLASQILSRWHPRSSREWWGSPHTDRIFQGLPQVGVENSAAKAPSVLFALDKPCGNIAHNKGGKNKKLVIVHICLQKWLLMAAPSLIPTHASHASWGSRAALLGKALPTGCRTPQSTSYTRLLCSHSACFSSHLASSCRSRNTHSGSGGVSSLQIWRIRFSPTCDALSACQTNLYLLALTFK